MNPAWFQFLPGKNPHFYYKKSPRLINFSFSQDCPGTILGQKWDNCGTTYSRKFQKAWDKIGTVLGHSQDKHGKINFFQFPIKILDFWDPEKLRFSWVSKKF